MRMTTGILVAALLFAERECGAAVHHGSHPGHRHRRDRRQPSRRVRRGAPSSRPISRRTLVTGSDGRYVFLQLPPGTYRSPSRSPASPSYVQEDIVLTVGQSITLPVAMKVSGVAETVTVRTSPRVIESTRTSAATTLDERDGGDAADPRPQVRGSAHADARRQHRPGAGWRRDHFRRPARHLQQHQPRRRRLQQRLLRRTGRRAARRDRHHARRGQGIPGHRDRRAGRVRPHRRRRRQRDHQVGHEHAARLAVLLPAARSRSPASSRTAPTSMDSTASSSAARSAVRSRRTRRSSSARSRGSPATSRVRTWAGSSATPRARSPIPRCRRTRRSSTATPIASAPRCCRSSTPGSVMDEALPIEHPVQTVAVLGKFDINASPNNSLSASWNFNHSRKENETFDVATYGTSANGIEGDPARINVGNLNWFTTLSDRVLNEAHFTYSREKRPRTAAASNLAADTGMGFSPTFRFGNPFFLQPAVDELIWRTQIKDNVSIVRGRAHHQGRRRMDAHAERSGVSRLLHRPLHLRQRDRVPPLRVAGGRRRLRAADGRLPERRLRHRARVRVPAAALRRTVRCCSTCRGRA